MKTLRRNEDKLEVVETIETVESIDIKDLKEQKRAFKEYADAEIKRFNDLIAEAKKLGLE